jgi:Transglycosylase SLT domain
MSLSADVKSFIANASGRFGVSQKYLAATSLFESGGNVNATTGSAQGLFQFMPGTASQYGLENPFDGQASSYAAAQLAVDNGNFLQRALGRSPSNAELYLAHQQGAGGALALLTHGSERAASVVGLSQVTGNGGNADMTASQFVAMLSGKYDKFEKQADGLPDDKTASADGSSSSGWKPDATMGFVEGYFVRAVVVVVGFIFIGVGLTMFRNQSDRTVLGKLKPLEIENTHSGEVELVQTSTESAPQIAPPDSGGGVGDFLKALESSPKPSTPSAAGFIKRTSKAAQLPPRVEQPLEPVSSARKEPLTVEAGIANHMKALAKRKVIEPSAFELNWVPSKRSTVSNADKERQRDAVKALNDSPIIVGSTIEMPQVLGSVVATKAERKKFLGTDEPAKVSAPIVPPPPQNVVAKAVNKLKPLTADELAALKPMTEDELAALNATIKPAKVAEVGGFKGGNKVELLDPEGVGRTSEPFEILELWTDPKHGAYAKLRGTHSGESFFPVADLKKLDDGIMMPIGKKGPTQGVARRALAAIRKTDKALKGES